MPEITPKSPEELLKEFDKEWLAPEHPEAFKGRDCYAGEEHSHDERVYQAKMTRLQRDWLTEAFASVIKWSMEGVVMKENVSREGRGNYINGYLDAITYARKHLTALADNLKKD